MEKLEYGLYSMRDWAILFLKTTSDTKEHINNVLATQNKIGVTLGRSPTASRNDRPVRAITCRIQ